MKLSPKLWILFLFFSNFASYSYSGIRKIDPKSLSFQNKIDSIYPYIFTDPQKSLDYLKLLKENNLDMSDTLRGKLMNVEGIAYAVSGNLEASISSFTNALQWLNETPKVYARVEKNLGNVYRNSGRFKESFTYYYNALKKAFEISDLSLVAQLYGEIASSFSQLEKNDFALDYLQKAIQKLEYIQPVDSTSILILQQKLANVFLRKGDYANSIKIYEAILPKLKQSARKDVYYLTLGNKASLLINHNKLDSVYEILQEAKAGIMQAQLNHIQPFLYTKFGKYFDKTGQMDSAAFYYQKVIEVFDVNNSQTLPSFIEYMQFLSKNKAFDRMSEMIDFVDALVGSNDFLPIDQIFYNSFKAEVLAQRGDYQAAYEMMLINNALKDSLKNNNNDLLIHAFVQKGEQERAFQNEIIWRKEAEINNRKSYFYLALLVFTLVLGAFYFKLKNYRTKFLQMENERLEELHKQEQILLKEQKKEIVQSTSENLILHEKLLQLSHSLNDNLKTRLNLSNLQADSQLLKSIIKRFELLDHFWLDQLKQAAPQITRSEIEFCLLVHLGLSYKEIAQLLNISHASVHTKKYRLIKKLGLQESMDLQTWLAQQAQP